jgi:type I restriction enzyme S subunit
VTPAVFVVRREWLREEGSRLDATPFSEGGLHAREAIRNLSLPIAPLGQIADVFAVSLRQRQFVRTPSRGVRFLASADLSLVDPPRDFWLSRARTRRVDSYTVEPHWALISSTGTVGHVTYVRDDLADCAVSQDAIRVRAKGEIAPGYLFAFLSTRVARVLISLRMYGTTVDRIHPSQLVDIPIPLPGLAHQSRIHDLVARAADARTEATKLLDDTGRFFDTLAGDMPSAHDHARTLGIVRARDLNGRLDAFHHVGWAAEGAASEGEAIGELADVISTKRVPRIYAERGVPFLSGIDVFRIRPTQRVLLATWIADSFAARVRAGDLAVQGSGQRYGLLGRVAYIGDRLDGWAASHDLFRIRCSDRDTRARIFTYCRSESGHRAMLRHSYGTSIPHVNPDGIAALRVPTLPSGLSDKAVRALELREQADRDEEQAIGEVEEWLA